MESSENEDKPQIKVYQIEFSNRAIKQFGKLPEDVQKQIATEINKLSQNPRPSGTRKLEAYKDKYRIKSGDYRVIYEVKDSSLIVMVLATAHRKSIYKEMSRY